jgi:hypothetical protein
VLSRIDIAWTAISILAITLIAFVAAGFATRAELRPGR